MMKQLVLLIAFAFTGLCFSIQSGDNERFKHYKAVSKTQEIEVFYLTWPDRNLPNFVKVEDYKKHVNQSDLINHCFYIDAKDPEKRKFKVPTTTDKLIKKIPLKIRGKFYKTTQFDEHFPNPLFEDMRKTGDLPFKPKNGEFLVFVLD